VFSNKQNIVLKTFFVGGCAEYELFVTQTHVSIQVVFW
jgi:hypothetical protein